jgi:hypothetical protein
MLAIILGARRRERPHLRGHIKLLLRRAKNFTSPRRVSAKSHALAIGAKRQGSPPDGRELVIAQMTLPL